MQPREYKIQKTTTGKYRVVRISERGVHLRIATYTNPHAADAVVRLLNNMKNSEF